MAVINSDTYVGFLNSRGELALSVTFAEGPVPTVFQYFRSNGSLIQASDPDAVRVPKNATDLRVQIFLHDDGSVATYLSHKADGTNITLHFAKPTSAADTVKFGPNDVFSAGLLTHSAITSPEGYSSTQLFENGHLKSYLLTPTDVSNPTRVEANFNGTTSTVTLTRPGAPAITESALGHMDRLLGHDRALLISNDGGGLISNDGGGLISNDGGGLISNDGGGLKKGSPALLIGNDGGGLISNDGGGLISNDGGGLISNDGGGLISNDGGGLISNDGGGLLGNDGAGTRRFMGSGPGSGSGAEDPVATLAKYFSYYLIDWMSGGLLSGGADDYGQTASKAGFIAVDGVATGAIEQAKDRDWFQTGDLIAGQTYFIELRGQDSRDGTLQDPFLAVYDVNGALVADIDDGGLGLNSRLTFQAGADGPYFIEARAREDAGKGTYRLSLDTGTAAPTITTKGDDGMGGDAIAVAKVENGTAVTTVFANTVPLGGTVTYSIIGGDDQRRFGISASQGDLKFLVAPDFEAPMDADRNNTYVVVVQARDDANGLVDTQTITVTVTDDAGEPAFTSDGGKATATIDILENTREVTKVQAGDATGAALTYSIFGGPDGHRFDIDATTGRLSFKRAPDFEAFADQDHDNSYLVEVAAYNKATGLYGTQVITVNVANVPETGLPFLAIQGDSLANRIDATHPGKVNGVAALPGADGDLIYGLAGNDTLDGLLGNDTVYGGSGDDILVGSVGFDDLDGGDGIDTVTYAASARAVAVDLRNQGKVAAGAKDDLPLEQRGGDAAGDYLWSIENVVGSAFHDSLIGNAKANVLSGGAGNDTLEGGAGADKLYGGSVAGATVVDDGAGIDTLSYAGSSASAGTASKGVSVDLRTFQHVLSGADAQGDVAFGFENIIGSNYDDVLAGSNASALSAGANLIDGGLGQDVILGGSGADTLLGGGGSDLINGDDAVSALSGNDSVDGGEGHDTVLGGGGDDTISGGQGNDVLWGDASLPGAVGYGNDKIEGGAGDDVIGGGRGLDTLDGGEGIDTLTFQDAKAGVLADLRFEDQGPGGAGGKGDNAGDSIRGFENLAGSAFDDTLIGDGGGNRIAGAAGKDSLVGGDGNDVLLGGDGSDTLSGGTGEDLIEGGAGGDRLVAGNDGDTLSYRGSALGVFVTFGAASQVALLGDAAGDTLVGAFQHIVGSATGGDGLVGDGQDNRIEGLGGNDLISGGAGNDTLEGGDGIDTLSFAYLTGPGLGAMVKLRDTIAVSGLLETDTISGFENVTGSARDDTIQGNAAANVLDGGAGVDWLSYEESKGGVAIDLANRTARSFVVTAESDAKGDVISNFENLVGSRLQDLLVGSLSDNVIAGLDGNDSLEGLAGKDLLLGDAGNDTLVGDFGTADGVFGDDTLIGGDGDDWLIGARGNDSLEGGAGNDRLTGDPRGFIGNDSLNGGADNDTLSGGLGFDTLDGGAGIDTLDFANATALVKVTLNDDGTATATAGEASGETLLNFEAVTGSAFNDELTGNKDANLLVGGLGNDSLNGGAGSDTISGGLGFDTLDGGAGIDTLDFSAAAALVKVVLADDGTATATAGEASGETLRNFENITGSGYADEITGNGGVNWLAGGAGGDLLIGGLGADDLSGGDGADTLFGGRTTGIGLTRKDDGTDLSADFLRGGAGNDLLDGGAGNDELWGGAGDDTLIGGKGADRLHASDPGLVDTGRDTVSYAGAMLGVLVDLGINYATFSDAAGDTLLGQFEDAIGGAGNDTLTGSSIANRLVGGIGHDSLSGGAGNDTLDGGDGNDVLFGGDDNDSILAGAGTDLVEGGKGADTLDGGTSFNVDAAGKATTAHADMLSYQNSDKAVTVDIGLNTASGGHAQGDKISNFENLRGSAYNDKLTGSAGANFIVGGDGSDTISGGLGNDTVMGGRGDLVTLKGDLLVGGAGIDTLSYASSGAGVRVNLAASGTLLFNGALITLQQAKGGDAEGDTISGFEGVAGSSYNDTLLGTAANEAFDGGSGDDSIDAGGGNDIIFDTGGADTLIGGAGDDSIQVVGTGQALIRGGAGKDLIRAGATQILSYEGSQGAVTVDLNTTLTQSVVHASGYTGSLTIITTKGGDAEGDLVAVGIRNVLGSSGADTITGDKFDNVIEGGAGADILDGGGLVTYGAPPAPVFSADMDRDTLSYQHSEAGQGVTVSLVVVGGVQSASGGDAQGDVVKNFSNVIGTQYADNLTGNSSANALTGGAGADTIDGGDGADTIEGGAGADDLRGGVAVGFGDDLLSYAGSTGANGGVFVDLHEVGGFQSASGGDAAGDVIREFEDVSGSGGADTLIGNDGANDLTGNGGNDSLIGHGGADLLSGGDGDDTLVGGEGGDILSGGTGSKDIISYEGSLEGVSVNLVTGAASGGDAAGDLLIVSTIEGIIGSGHDDTLVGSAGDNILEGGAGADSLAGGGGHDTFVFRFGFGEDTIGGFGAGSGLDDVIAFHDGFFASAQAAVDAATDQFDPGGAFVGAKIANGFDSILLVGVHKADLHENDFLIVS